MKLTYRTVIGTACILALCISTARADVHSFTETFTSSAYKDTIHTTADWNTTAGALQLFPFVASVVGSYDTPGGALGVTVSGDRAFVADGASGLLVFDITDPANPLLLGSYDTTGNASAVAVDGDLACVADGVSGLQVISITNPANPALLGTYNTSGTAIDVKIDGDYAFVADAGAGLRIIGIANPASPTLLGTYDTAGQAYAVDVEGDLAYVADRSDGLVVINVEDPASPTLVSTYDTPGDSWGIAVGGDVAYVGDTTQGLQVINVSNPHHPALITNFNHGGSWRRLHLDGDYLYAGAEGNMIMADVTDPAHVSVTTIVSLPGIATTAVVDGDHVFVADGAGGGLQVVQVALATHPTLVGTYGNDCNHVAVDGDLAFIAGYIPGLEIVDISDPALPVQVGTYATNYAFDVAVAGNLAFIMTVNTGLQIIDIGDPANPALVGGYTLNYANAVAVAGDLAFIADGLDGLRIIDIGDPVNPALIGTYDTSGDALDVAVAGDVAFVADHVGGFLAVDVSDPTNPYLKDVDNQAIAYDVAVAGDYAYVAAGDSGLEVVDVTNYLAPVAIFDISGDARGVAVAGNLAFVTDGSSVVVVDVVNPPSPALLDTYATPGDNGNVAVAGDLAFVSDGFSGLRILQVFQRDFDAVENVGQSININPLLTSLARVRLSGTVSPGVTLEVSTDGGTGWESISTLDTWTEVVPGPQLMWRSTHEWTTPGVNPSISDLQIDWVDELPMISAVTDIPHDQGKQVRIEWLRTSHDFVGDGSQIMEYAIYRKHAASWDYLATVPARAQDEYAMVVPTLEDSTIAAGLNMTTFRVTALTATPGLVYHSPPDSGYSVDNLVPGVPANVVVAYNTGAGNTLSWDDSVDPDFNYFRIYRSDDPAFAPSPATLVHTTVTTGWVDPDYDGGGVFYKVTAVDQSGNESGASGSGTVSDAGVPKAPTTFTLYPNVPNPFNPETVIRYDVPSGGGVVALGIYDVAGRLVRTLVDGAVPAGSRSARWDGRDNAGRRVASGVYFCQFTAPNYSSTTKMVLMK